MPTRELASSVGAATHDAAPRTRAPWRALRLLLAAALALVPVSAGATIFYTVGVGFRQPEFFVNDEDTVPQVIDVSEFSFGGALCPTPGTPNYLCGRLLAEAGNNGGRLFLRSVARFERTNATANGETAAYATATIWLTEMGGYVAPGPAPMAAFYFGLSGTLSRTASSASVTTQAFAQATLQTSSVNYIQCFGEVDCTPKPSVEKVMVTDWDPRLGFRLTLRSDVSALGVPNGWDAEVVADFADTLEILAIEVMDENGKPMPEVVLTALDGNGDPIVTFPNEAPAPEPGQALLALTGGLVWAMARRRSNRA